MIVHRSTLTHLSFYEFATQLPSTELCSDFYTPTDKCGVALRCNDYFTNPLVFCKKLLMVQCRFFYCLAENL